jgi:diazepam-binding inhibitor (GABA receptor modulating acyl-CoA-binding protein)
MDSFEQAVAFIQSRGAEIRSRVSNDDQLVLYALFKQATVGDNSAASAPSRFLDPKGFAKWNAWNQMRGGDAASSQTAYVAEVHRIAQHYNL